MRRIIGITATLFLAFCLGQTAEAAVITYESSNLGGNRWQYDYTIFNDSASDIITAFDINFDFGYYSNIEHLSSPAGWDSVADDPFSLGTNLEIDGILTAWALEEAFYLLPNNSLGIFSVVFDWFGNDAPLGQLYVLYGDNNWNIIGDGWTAGVPPEIPEPQTFMLLGTGILAMAAYYRRKQSVTTGKK